MVEELEKIKNLQKVKSFNIDKYDGLKTEIESVSLSDVKDSDFGLSQQLIIKTKPLDDDFQVTEYINLKFDKDTQTFGIPEDPNSNAMKFLAYFKAKDFTEVINKPCMIVKRVNPKKNKAFLGIHYG